LSGPAETGVYLGLGGNLGDPVQAMGEALRGIDADRQCIVLTVSSVYRTPPWGKTDQPDFLNCAAGIVTTRRARELLQLCLDIELGLKRERRERWGPRIVDLDVLVYGNVSIDEPGLAIPHPRMLERAFVMVPLAEIVPDLDLSGQSVTEHAQKLDRSGITKLDLSRDWWKHG
jgi:2-amino-4-hydroxy-6-hydroxymethyldihydropteridine diphosphokinase